jgi:hypothetical protein
MSLTYRIVKRVNLTVILSMLSPTRALPTLRRWQADPATACRPALLYEKLVTHALLGDIGVLYLWQREARRLGVDAEWQVIFDRGGDLVLEGRSWTMEHVRRIIALGLREKRPLYVETGINMCLQWHGVIVQRTGPAITTNDPADGSTRRYECQHVSRQADLQMLTADVLLQVIESTCSSTRTPFRFLVASCTRVEFFKFEGQPFVRFRVEGLCEDALLNAHDFIDAVNPDTNEWI